MGLQLPSLHPDQLYFPPVDSALHDPDGLLAYGGDLSVERLRCAYQRGIFPWFSPGEPILWWSPTNRAVISKSSFHLSKSMRKTLRKSKFTVSINRATESVIKLCAETRSVEETWITQEMVNAYIELAHHKLCHSVEVWKKDKLVGGLYGVAIGKVFCGESMFSLEDNASKTAMSVFQHHFFNNGGTLIDCQLENPHLTTLGAMVISREEFLTKLTSNGSPMPTSFYGAQVLTNPWSLG
ncbi:leucyl/phenylalanyl-tRNA--protein transferase [Vibrio ulleungensis]|uniref:Leucyl/phenylalanyl-tRNA--protein transferase n=1 Tax=Vibrio ulleungensis TaxID=2807619 RepID=A0ABS2HH26_9VIBR|nr:leucyl/phenylalanyl-tRNA--protein transferase [Vibrio ulleungensis]MBM7036845.1 leucyl/phenylalanyl-tRNA--protein transferase [Vibrio ulleungensis]